MDEMRERRTQAAQQERHADCHAELLDSRRQLDRLDTRRHELRAAGDRSEAEALADRGQRAQQILDVRLVARPAATQDVGVDHDERIAHADSS
jgi:hypothetical protein